MGIDQWTSDYRYIYLWKESFRRNRAALTVTRSLNAVLGAISKMTMNLVLFQGKLFNITVTQVYAPITDAEEAEVPWF